MLDPDKNFPDKSAADANQEEISHLSHTITQIYSRLYRFDRSFLGRIVRVIEILYALLSLRPRSRSYYRQVIDDARLYSATFGINYAEHETRVSRLRLLGRVLNYLIRHPHSSLRLITPFRVKRLFSMLIKADPGLANSWVNERFPVDEASSYKPVIFPVEEHPDQITLEFPLFDEIEVSIIVPVYNHYRTTISCLQAVIAHTHGISYELIIADDCSQDLTNTIESRIKNITVVRAAENQGFLMNCNNAVRHARGRYTVLLNNDTNVQPNWLASLLSLAERTPGAGLVGPKLIFEDGMLQEAGGIIWRDATGWNYGRGHNPDAPEYNYVKEVDYISGACILIKKCLWEKLGGFDERFCPAYYEDTDLAFRVREAGYKVLYQPESVVVHFEGVSNGSDLNTGIKKHQRINQKVFYQKWKGLLEDKHYPNGHNIFRARDRSSSKTNVVFIDHYVPFYDKDAGSRSTFFYVKTMVEMGLNVKFIGANFFPHQPYTKDLQNLGVEVIFGERYARGWKRWFTENCSEIDIVYLHRPHITEDFIGFLKELKPCPRLIYFGHDLHFLRTEREAELLNEPQLLEAAESWKKRELAIFDKVDIVYYPSEVEVEKVKQLRPKLNVMPIPLYLLNSGASRNYNWEQRSGLLFVGGFNHPPNTDAVKWFVNQVMPLLDSYDDTIILHVVGSSVPDEIEALASDRVIVHGFLSDERLEELYSEVRLCIVPLRFGAGVKGKVLEGLQAGLPIVTTEIGAEGIPDAESVLKIASEEQSFAEAVRLLYGSPDECYSYLERYPAYIDRHFGVGNVQSIIKSDFVVR